MRSRRLCAKRRPEQVQQNPYSITLSASTGSQRQLEYNYMDFGSAAVPFAFPPPFNSFSITDRVHIVKLGLNYKLGWHVPARCG
jgi:hypothetical protein